jgi:hypothetical protein
VKKFKASPPEKLGEEATIIFNKFLGPRAKTPVNLPGSVVSTISARMASGEITQDMFQDAANQIYWLMKSDTFVRFQAKFGN